MREPRTEQVMIRMTPADMKAIDRAATKAGMNRSEWLRAAAMTMLVLEGDAHAMKQLGTGMMRALRGAGELKQRELSTE